MSYPQTTFQNVRFQSGGFWSQKRKDISAAALKYQLKVLKDTGRYDAFKLKWHPIYDDEPEIWPVPKHQFWDSDVAKFIEGACYFLAAGGEDAQVRDHVEELVDMIATAQQPDGYLNIHFTVVEPGKRFTNLRDLHELYNAGHLIEAALAHERAFGNEKLLLPIIKYVDLLCDVFGPKEGQKPGYPGHPEIELALLRLFERTKEPKHLELARFFLTERGNPHGVQGQHYYDWEEKLRGETRVPDYFPEPRSYWYQQAHVPIVEQQTIEGHSVRAMYLLTALADILRIESSQGQVLDGRYNNALHRLWDNMVQKKMYLTGGIGSTKQWEGFSYDYFLPQGTDEGGCYAETCASIGVMMLADRLLQIDPQGRYGDVAELALYNAVLTGVSCSGLEWTYVNQLASSATDPSRRSAWFTVACCPPNVLRLLGNLGGYLYSAHSQHEARTLNVQIILFSNVVITEQVAGETVKIEMKTAWPLDGQVDLIVTAPADVRVELSIRVPSWCSQDWTVEPQPSSRSLSSGFLKLDAAYVAAHPNIRMNCKMEPRLIKPSTLTGQNVVAVARGPLIYCVEDFDNDWVTDHFSSTGLRPQGVKLEEEEIQDKTTGERFVQVTARGGCVDLSAAVEEPRELPYAFADTQRDGKPQKDLVFVPYYFRANRGGRGQMRVGLKAVD